MALATVVVAPISMAAARRVAITIDDLPVGGDRPDACSAERIVRITKTLLAPVREQHIPVTGFFNQGRCTGLNDELNANYLHRLVRNLGLRGEIKKS